MAKCEPNLESASLLCATIESEIDRIVLRSKSEVDQQIYFHADTDSAFSTNTFHEFMILGLLLGAVIRIMDPKNELVSVIR